MELNTRSRLNLAGVKADLARVVHDAADRLNDTLGFVVTEGLRTEARQRELVAAGASQTMRSKHLTGDAVDLAATVGGSIRWDWPLYFKLAEVVRDAAAELGVRVRWGGCWCELTPGLDVEKAQADYAAAKRAAGAKPFLDGPHYEVI